MLMPSVHRSTSERGVPAAQDRDERRPSGGVIAGRPDDCAPRPRRRLCSRPVRLLVARCEIDYRGRGSTFLPMGTRLIMQKQDGTVAIHSDGGGAYVKPLNWMTPPTVIEEEPGLMVVRKLKGEDR